MQPVFLEPSTTCKRGLAANSRQVEAAQESNHPTRITHSSYTYFILDHIYHGSPWKPTRFVRLSGIRHRSSAAPAL